jgi:hypothetical protein
VQRIQKFIFLLIAFLFACKNNKHQPNAIRPKSAIDSFIDHVAAVKFLPKKLHKNENELYHVADTFCKNPPTYIFLRPLEFEIENFRDGIIQHDAIWDGSGDGAIFKSFVHFRECQIFSKYVNNNSCSFIKARFDAPIELDTVVGPAKLEFMHCQFNSRLTLFNDDYSYQNLIRIYFCKSDSEIAFSKSVYYIDEFEKRGTVFRKDVELVGDTILGKIDFNKCQFLDSSSLFYNYSTLPDTLDFSNVTLSNTIDFTKAYPNVYGRKCQINLLNTDISKIRLNYKDFELFFPDSILNSPGYSQVIYKTYQLLLDNLKLDKQDDQFSRLDIELKNWRAKNNFLLWIDKIWWLYGYEKWRVVPNSFFIILFFSVVNFFLFRSLIDTYAISDIKESYDAIGVSFPYNLLRRFQLVLFYTCIIFFKISWDINKLKFGKTLVVTTLFFEYAIGLVCTGFILNLIAGK